MAVRFPSLIYPFAEVSFSIVISPSGRIAYRPAIAEGADFFHLVKFFDSARELYLLKADRA